MWDLDKFFFGFDDFILGSNHFLILPSCPKKYCSIQKKSKVAKNNHLAFSSSLSLNTHGIIANWQSKVIFYDKSLEKKYLQVSRKFFNGEKRTANVKYLSSTEHMLIGKVTVFVCVFSALFEQQMKLQRKEIRAREREQKIYEKRNF